MASIRQRNGKWQAQVRLQDVPPASKTFSSKSDALRWARQTEAEADKGNLPINRGPLRTTTLAHLVERYLEEIVPGKRGHQVETVILKAFLRHAICRHSLARLSFSHFAAYRDERLLTITPKSLERQLSPLRNMFSVAMKDWGYPLVGNFLLNLRLPSKGPARARRLRQGEFSALQQASDASRNNLLYPIAAFALETAMRRGELLSLLWENIDIHRRLLTIPVTKNGHPRVVPLSAEARRILNGLDRVSERVFPLSEMALRHGWNRLTVRAGVNGLHFHDLRHEAISRLFEKGLSIPEVASISGHRDIRMLMRYAHPDTDRVIQLLDA